MRIRLSDPAYVYDLIDFLRRAEIIAVESAGKTIEAHVPRLDDQAQARRELRLYLRTWEAMHPDVTAELVD